MSDRISSNKKRKKKDPNKGTRSTTIFKKCYD